MPNFQSKTLKTLSYPSYYKDIEFEWEATNNNETLISVRYKNENFFIKKIQRKNDFLVKGDKLSKPSRVKYLQNVLFGFEQLSQTKPSFSNIHTSKNRHEKTSKYFKNIDFFVSEFKSFANNFKKISIELGFGSGRHLLYQAKQNPNTLFIGIEIHKPSIEQVIKQCEKANLKNILIADYDGRVLLEFLPSNILSQIFIHFPIPWDKKPHRRIISAEFLREARRVLKQDGTLEIRTDSDMFFFYSIQIFLECHKNEIKIQKNKDLDISSKYEDRWKKMQKNIYDLIMINQSISEEKEAPKMLNFTFKSKAKKLKKETILKQGYFVHFEKCFTIDEKHFLWQISLGDTTHTEHCYLKVFDENISYFPKQLYASKNNLLAHELISQRLQS